MSEETEIDAEALRSEVEQIKGAMGLEERYPSQFQLWLVFGLAVVIASAGSQMIALRDLTPFLHAVAWWVPLTAAGLYQGWRTSKTGQGVGTTETKPRLTVLWLSLFGLYFAFFVILVPVTADLESNTVEILLFSLIIGLIGVGYLVVGETLRAYYIRRRDRVAFYLGGVWMLVLAVLMPNVGLLQTWGYMTFGLLYGLHALASYLVLR
jgi:hypothetical protein